jgi:DNA-binding response OmpR family regulator
MGVMPRHDPSRILVVEAGTVAALDLRQSLEAVGCAVLGPVGSREGAMGVLRRERPDLVVLGTALGDGSSLPVAQQLVSADVPLALFARGDDGMLGHPMLRTVSLLPKPYTPPQLTLLVHRLVRTTVLTSLHRTEQRVARAWQIIAAQSRTIHRLEERGHDTAPAQELLAAYNRALAILEQQEERLTRVLAWSSRAAGPACDMPGAAIMAATRRRRLETPGG